MSRCSVLTISRRGPVAEIRRRSGAPWGPSSPGSTGRGRRSEAALARESDEPTSFLRSTRPFEISWPGARPDGCGCPLRRRVRRDSTRGSGWAAGPRWRRGGGRPPTCRAGLAVVLGGGVAMPLSSPAHSGPAVSLTGYPAARPDQSTRRDHGRAGASGEHPLVAEVTDWRPKRCLPDGPLPHPRRCRGHGIAGLRHGRRRRAALYQPSTAGIFASIPGPGFRA